MKKLILSLAVIAAAFGANAQSDKKEMKQWNFSIGAEGSLPIGDFGDGYQFGFGGSVQADYNVDANLAITANAGVLSYSGKTQTYSFTVFGTTTTTTVKNPTFTIVPVMAGIKYTFGGSSVYGSAQIGAAFNTKSGGTTSLAYAPGIGYKFSPNFDALVKYQGFSANSTTSSAVGLRVAYTF